MKQRTGNVGGRPTKFNADIANTIIETVRAGNYTETAAAMAGISKVTFYDWLKRGARGEQPFQDFRNQILESMAVAEDRAVRAILDSGHWQALAWWLERTRSEKYGRKDKLTASVDSTHTQRAETIFEAHITADEVTRDLLRQVYEREQRMTKDGTDIEAEIGAFSEE